MIERRWLRTARLCLWVCLWLGLGGSLWGCGAETHCGEFPLDEERRLCVVETVDQMVVETFPFAEYKGVDLKEFSRELRMTLEGETPDVAFLEEVAAVVSRLRDGHTRVERRTLEEPGVAPVRVEVEEGPRGDRLVVVGADEGFQEWIGAAVVAVDGEPVSEAVERHRGWVEAGRDGEVALSGPTLLLAGEAGTEVVLSLEGGGEVVLTRRRALQPPASSRVGKGGQIGVLKLETFGHIDDLERIDEILNDLMDTRGLIIDLRGNGGGYPSVTDGLFGRLIDRPVPPFELVDRYGKLYRQLEAPPRGETYEGHVVVLVDRRSYSASNYLAHRIVYYHRGVLVGQPTGGGAASPNRGVMLVPGVWFQVSTYVLRTPTGDHSESGLMPGILVPAPTAKEQYAGEDRTLQRAIEYLEALR